MNSKKPTINIIKFEGSMDLCNSNLKSIKGCSDCLSIIVNNTNETIPVATKLSSCAVEPTTETPEHY